MALVVAGEALLQIEDLYVEGDRGGDALRGASLEVRAGEILGLAGVSGNGRRELAEALVGLRPVRSGRVILNGKDVTHSPPAERIRAGQSYIPEERMCEGAIKEFSVADNLICLLEQRAAGTVTLLISEDLDEINPLSDRIAVMFEGKIMGIVERGEATLQELGLMMAGVTKKEEVAAAG